MIDDSVRKVYKMAVERFDNAVFVEVGSYKGSSALFMAEEIKKAKKNIRLFCVDKWTKIETSDINFDVYNEFIETIRDHLDIIVPIKTDSAWFARRFPFQADFIYIDGDHSFESCLLDIVLWRRKLKPDGWIGGHDYTWEDVRDAVNEAIHEPGRLLATIKEDSWLLK